MKKTTIADPAVESRDEFPIVIAAAPASGRQRKIAFGAFIAMAVIVAIALPFANAHLARIDAFVPAVQFAMSLADLLTAVLLFAQYSVYPQRALLALASGYVFSGLFAFLEAWALLGAFALNSPIDRVNVLNSVGWLFVFWHIGFPLSVIVYALSKDASEAADRSGKSTGTIIGGTIACVITATAGLTWVATAGVGYLPNIYQSAAVLAPFAHYSAPFLLSLSVTTLVLLFFRRRTILDHWLIVVLFAWLPTFTVAALFTSVQFTVGWYVARVYALFAGSALLFALLAETVVLYTRLANAIVQLRRERIDRLAIFNTVVDGIITIDHKGAVVTLNPAAARLFGHDPEEVIGRNVKMLMPEPFRSEHDTYLVNYLETGQAKVIGIGRQVYGLRKDGSNFPMEVSVSETEVAGRRMFTGVLRDITRRKRSEERQRLLVGELDHRVKNILAQVAVVAASTRRDSRSIDDFLGSLSGRIQSMAIAHTLLSEAGWHAVGLDALICKLLAPYVAGTNVTISGPDVVLDSAKIQAVARVLHELATNAAKYGALSIPSGQVAVNWDLKPNGAVTHLHLVWRELGGPPVTSAHPSSYGTNLIRNLIPHELGGTVDLMFAKTGVSCRIEIAVEPA
jgi:PAS domain S-box-containing protein